MQWGFYNKYSDSSLIKNIKNIQIILSFNIQDFITLKKLSDKLWLAQSKLQ